MKVSTKLFNEQQIRQFSSLNADIQKLQDRISSGKNIVVASDDPVGSAVLRSTFLIWLFVHSGK